MFPHSRVIARIVPAQVSASSPLFGSGYAGLGVKSSGRPASRKALQVSFTAATPLANAGVYRCCPGRTGHDPDCPSPQEVSQLPTINSLSRFGGMLPAKRNCSESQCPAAVTWCASEYTLFEPNGDELASGRHPEDDGDLFQGGQ